MDTESLIEQVTSAHRERGGDGQLRPARAFHDLAPEDRARAFERTLEQRRLEAAADAEGMSTTARAVLDRISRGAR